MKHERAVKEKGMERKTYVIPLLFRKNTLTSDNQEDIPHRKEERKSTAPSSPETEQKRERNSEEKKR